LEKKKKKAWIIIIEQGNYLRAVVKRKANQGWHWIRVFEEKN